MQSDVPTGHPGGAEIDSSKRLHCSPASGRLFAEESRLQEGKAVLAARCGLGASGLLTVISIATFDMCVISTKKSKGKPQGENV